MTRFVLGQAMFTKVIVVVDHDVDIHNYSEVVWKTLCAWTRTRRAISLGHGHAGSRRTCRFGSKMGLTPRSGHRRFANRADEIVMDENTKHESIHLESLQLGPDCADCLQRISGGQVRI